MLRASFLRARPIAPAARLQWRVAHRFFADSKKPDETLLPGSQSTSANAEIPSPPLTTPSNLSPIKTGTIPPNDVPKTPPASGEVRSAPAVSPAATPPTGTGSSNVAPQPQAPKPKKRRFRRFIIQLLILSALGYAGGVYYSLVSDNFHDFFTEYVPFGEDAVGYFEEREFRRRFPGQAGTPRLHPQVKGEPKITIPSKHGLSWRVAENGDSKRSDLALKGRHLSAVEEAKPPTSSGKQEPQNVASQPTPATQKPVEETKKEALPAKEKPTESATHNLLPKGAVKAEPKKEEPAKSVSAPASTAPLVDNLEVPSAKEPVVQDVVKILNDIITVINADAAASKYSSVISKAKSDLGKVISDITALKENEQKAAEEKIRVAHTEFDSAARELISRLDQQMQEQEAHWKEEYESEREKLAQSYKQKLQSELEVAQKVHNQRLKNELLEQSIALQRSFSSTIRDRVETERDGRLSKLTELSDSIHELEKLTAEWNSVVDANLKTQHLVVAVEAVKTTLEKADAPKPFTTELAALKEIAADDPVVAAAIASINPAAYQRGIPTASQLIDRFRRVAAEVRKAALLPEDAGVASHLASLAMSKFLFKKSGLAVGADVEAVLARTEVLLEEGDLDGAAREMNGLDGWAKVLSRDWLGEVRRVLEVRQALDVIATEARLQTLLVD
ncbi:mitochondrial inner membrane protein Mitofilin [Cenococcum geophilum]